MKFIRQTSVNDSILTSGKYYRVLNVTEAFEPLYGIESNNGTFLEVKLTNSRAINGGNWELVEDFEVYAVRTKHSANPIILNNHEYKLVQPVMLSDLFHSVHGGNFEILDSILCISYRDVRLSADGYWEYLSKEQYDATLLWDTPEIVEVETPRIKPPVRVFISNLTSCKSYLTSGKFYDIIEEEEYKCLILNDLGDEIWIGKNISEHLYGGKPELI